MRWNSSEVHLRGRGNAGAPEGVVREERTGDIGLIRLEAGDGTIIPGAADPMKCEFGLG
jgi:hypothetical protein